jgi:hypothetical protein
VNGGQTSPGPTLFSIDSLHCFPIPSVVSWFSRLLFLDSLDLLIWFPRLLLDWIPLVVSQLYKLSATLVIQRQWKHSERCGGPLSIPASPSEGASSILGLKIGYIYILWHADPLLGGESEICDCIASVARQRPANRWMMFSARSTKQQLNSNRGNVFSVRSERDIIIRTTEAMS